MQELSEIVTRLEESATLAMARRSREMTEQGIDVINLSLGEPDFNTPDFIKEAAKKAIDENYSKYPPVNGYLDVRKAIAQKFERDNGLKYSPEQIVVSTGAKQSIMNVCLSLINPGQEVILPAPYWVSYTEMVKMAGGVPVIVSAGIENNFKITAAQLKAAITPKTKLVLFSSPCNPSGSVFSRDELAALAKVIAETENLYVISDEIYEHINYVGKHVSIGSFPEIFDRVITVNGVSKAFAMTGYRIGYIGAPTWIAQACTKIQGQFTSAASSIAQRAAKAAVEADPAVVKYMQDAFKTRRDLVVKSLSQVPGFKLNNPDGAFYVLPDVSELIGRKYGDLVIQTPDDLCNFLLEEAHVATVSGEPFGADNCIRISYASSEETLIRAIERMKIATLKLQ